MSRRDNNGTNKSNIHSQGLDHHVKKGSVARVNRRLRRYYLIVRLLPNVFALACLSSSSIWYESGAPHDGKIPLSVAPM